MQKSKWNLSCLTGLGESESVVRDMLDLAKETNVPFYEVSLNILEYVEKNPSHAIGLLHLATGNLIGERWCGSWHGNYGPSRELIKRVIERHPEMGPLGPDDKELFFPQSMKDYMTKETL